MDTRDKCANCGADRGLHHWETDQCPRNGIEAPIGRRQEWETTTFFDEERIEAEKEGRKLLRGIVFKSKDGCARGYHISHKAQYKEVIDLPQIMVGLYHPDGSCEYEFAIRFISLNGLTTNLDIFGDSFKAFKDFADLFQSLAELETKPTEEEVIKVLKRLKFEDLTQYPDKIENPAGASLGGRGKRKIKL